MKTISRLFLKRLSLGALCLALIGLITACDRRQSDDTEGRLVELPGDAVQMEWKGGDQPKADPQADSGSIPITVVRQTASPSPPAPTQAAPVDSSEPYTVQVGAFLNPNNASRLIEAMQEKGYEATLTVTEAAVRKWNIVRIGHYTDETAALEAARQISRKENMETAVVKNDTIIKMLAEPSVTPTSKPVPQTVEKPIPAKTEKPPTSEGTKRTALKGEPYRFAYQIGGLHAQQNAQKHKNDLEKKGYTPYLVAVPTEHTSETWYALRIGYFETIDAAAVAASAFTQKEGIPTQALPVIN
jgi:cell division septation protein DedD